MIDVTQKLVNLDPDTCVMFSHVGHHVGDHTTTVTSTNNKPVSKCSHTSFSISNILFLEKRQCKKCFVCFVYFDTELMKLRSLVNINYYNLLMSSIDSLNSRVLAMQYFTG